MRNRKYFLQKTLKNQMQKNLVTDMCLLVPFFQNVNKKILGIVINGIIFIVISSALTYPHEVIRAR